MYVLTLLKSYALILQSAFKSTISQQKMLKITVSIKQRECFLIVQLEIVSLLFGILAHTVNQCQTTKTAEIRFTI